MTDTPTPFTERMNELIAWAQKRERAMLAISDDPAAHQETTLYHDGRASAFREVANHLRQLSQGAKTDEG